MNLCKNNHKQNVLLIKSDAFSYMFTKIKIYKLAIYLTFNVALIKNLKKCSIYYSAWRSFVAFLCHLFKHKIKMSHLFMGRFSCSNSTYKIMPINFYISSLNGFKSSYIKTLSCHTVSGLNNYLSNKKT